MKAWWRITILLVLATGCSHPQTIATSPISTPSAPPYVRVRVLEQGHAVIRDVTFEDYVETVTLSEFAPASDDPVVVERMFEIQSVVSRTYALAHLRRHERDGFDFCSTTHCQLYDPVRLHRSRWAAASREAVLASSGEVLLYRGVPIEAFFHADCGGRSSVPSAVWGGEALPYLVTAEDDGPAAAAHGTWQYDVGADALVRALKLDERTSVGDRLDSIDIVQRDLSGRAERISLRGARTAVLRGEDLRDVLSRAFGPGSLRSTLLEVHRDGTRFIFSGRGFGHGVGLCQVGALARVRAGTPVSAVLAHYFPGATIARLRTKAARR
jgi:stage II sporulation protein D